MKTIRTSFQVLVHPPEGDSGYGCEVLNLPGCFSAGDTLEETLDNVVEAIELHLSCMDPQQKYKIYENKDVAFDNDIDLVGGEIYTVYVEV